MSALLVQRDLVGVARRTVHARQVLGVWQFGVGQVGVAIDTRERRMHRGHERVLFDGDGRALPFRA
jgi:hypothetical protein